jgi:sensor c-di-GMP phosphodiesterase-like protein
LNAQVWQMLREQACDEAQGFHMSRPMPSHEFITWSTGWTARLSATQLTNERGMDVTLH